MICGLDLGSTLIKACWKNKKQYHCISTADYNLEDFVNILKKNQITEINAVGIASLPKNFNKFKINPPPTKDLIKFEINAQVAGLKKIFNLHGRRLPADYLLVSIGTGTSYSRVKKNKVTKIPLGNSLSGGTIMGLGQASLGLTGFNEIADLANEGNHKKADIYFHDLIISNLGRQDASLKDVAAGIMNVLAITTYKDLAIYDQTKYGNFKNVVYIGSALRNNDCLKKLLTKYTKELRKNPIFISGGEYATSLGALESHYN